MKYYHGIPLYAPAFIITCIIGLVWITVLILKNYRNEEFVEDFDQKYKFFVPVLLIGASLLGISYLAVTGSLTPDSFISDIESLLK
ncbi:hypothetical protein [uncultured Chryseobacterium sp.]|uniref:hypothetical protein n=1 Tax=uncultured Chryseobacterium sp. TaxID=259322 RepID=UPI0025E747E2|nr:hypothetical protein [uncultured Chryseobacterium sp.]